MVKVGAEEAEILVLTEGAAYCEGEAGRTDWDIRLGITGV